MIAVLIWRRLRSFALLLVASLGFLGLATNGSARPQTTAPGGYLTVRVTITDTGVKQPSGSPGNNGSCW